MLACFQPGQLGGGIRQHPHRRRCGFGVRGWCGDRCVRWPDDSDPRWLISGVDQLDRELIAHVNLARGQRNFRHWVDS